MVFPFGRLKKYLPPTQLSSNLCNSHFVTCPKTTANLFWKYLKRHETSKKARKTQVKKLMFSALKKTAIHGVNWDFSELNVGSWAVQGRWATFNGEKTALHGVALKKMAIHGVNWHFSALLRLALSFFHYGDHNPKTLMHKKLSQNILILDPFTYYK